MEKNYKILRVIARLNIGGPARNAVLLTEAFSNNRAGIDTVLVCGEVEENEGDMAYLAQEKGIRPVIVKELGRSISFRDDITAFYKLYRIICKEKPDLIHTHTAKAGTLGRLAGIIYNLTHPGNKKCKLVHTFHGHVLYGYFGRIKSCVFILIERILGLFTDTIITVSKALKTELVERFKIAKFEKISVVELGFELGELLKLELRKNRDSVNIGIVGRLVPIKNHKMFLEAVYKIKTSGYNSSDRPRPVRFIIIGDGELKSELQAYAKDLNIDDIVEFRGWITDVAEIYNDLDIVALTSINEGTPVSIIEAMASGKPIVAVNVGGVRDIVQDKKNGYLIDSDDVETFTDRLLDLIKDNNKCIQYGAYGRELVRNRFQKERLIKDMEGLYNKLLLRRSL